VAEKNPITRGIEFPHTRSRILSRSVKSPGRNRIRCIFAAKYDIWW